LPGQSVIFFFNGQQKPGTPATMCRISHEKALISRFMVLGGQFTIETQNGRYSAKYKA